MHYFDIGYGQLDFLMYRQGAQGWQPSATLKYYLGKVCGKNYLDDESLYIKNVGWTIFWVKKKDKKKCIILT